MERPAEEFLSEHVLEVAGYPTTAALRVFRLRTPQPGKANVSSNHGILVSSGDTSFVNTFFGADGDETPWIRGELDCPYITDLIRAYDNEGATEENPARLVLRDREGLYSEHPFFKALGSAVLDVLAPILEALRPKRSVNGGSDALRDNLKDAATNIAQLLRHDLEQIDSDEGVGGVDRDPNHALVIIPPQLALRAGSKRRLTVLVDESRITAGPLQAQSASPTVVKVKEISDRVPHKSLEGMCLVNVLVEALEIGHSVLTVTHQETGTSATCAVRVHDDEIEDSSPPLGLEWGNSSITVTVGKTRSVLLRAPIDIAENGELDCSVAITGEGCELLDKSVTLRLTNKGWLEGRCKVRGVDVSKSGKITATSSNASHETTAAIRATRPAAFDGTNVDFDILDEHFGNVRALLAVTDTGHVVRVYAQHPSLRTIIGERQDDGSFERDNEDDTRIALAEIVAAAIAEFLVRRDAGKQPHLYTDVDGTLAARNKYLNRYLMPLIKMLRRQEK